MENKARKFKVGGMSCAACSARVERAVSSLPGVTECAVNLLTGSMSVRGEAGDTEIIAAVVRAGYTARVDNGQTERSADGGKEEKSETRPLVIRLCVSAAFLLILMYISMGHAMWHFPLPGFLTGKPVALGWLELSLTLIILIINRKFFISGTKAVLHGSPNMDTLVAMGSSVAFIYSTVMLFMMGSQSGEDAMMTLHGLYFESAAMIVTLITVGKTLEAYAKGRTADAVKSLVALAPRMATVIRDGAEVKIPAAELCEGDTVVVRPGDSVPCDGVVTSGGSAVDESAFTGESIPAEKAVGDRLLCGTVNTSGYLQLRATGVGEDTTLSEMIRMVNDAQSTKAPIARVADKVSAVFVPAVIVIALITAVVWLIIGHGNVGHALERAISVLVISCPCALGLATPVAVMVGSGVAAKHGILFKSAAALEECGRAKTIALDKTGTVTKGTPAVTDVRPEGISEKELLEYAAAGERMSEHPLARSIVACAEERGACTKNAELFNALAGSGIEAVVDGKRLTGGNLKFTKTVCKLPSGWESYAASLADMGKTAVHFTLDGKFIGTIAMADEPREDSREAIAALRALGCDVAMLTGDNERTAKMIGKSVGIDEVYAGILPGDKEKKVRELKSHGKVIMVGDGVNDAPALSVADVGMAIGRGTDVAIESADVVLTGSSLTDVYNAVRISRRTLKNIRENLFWAFFYNCIGIPLAAGAFIPLFGWELSPMFGAAAMSLSSFCVVMNALRLNLINYRKKGGSTAPCTDNSCSVTKNTASGAEDAAHTGENTEEEENMEKTVEMTLSVEGMMCHHCEEHVKRALLAVPGVKSAEADHAAGTARIVCAATVSRDALCAAIAAAGYGVKN